MTFAVFLRPPEPREQSSLPLVASPSLPGSHLSLLTISPDSLYSATPLTRAIHSIHRDHTVINLFNQHLPCQTPSALLLAQCSLHVLLRQVRCGSVHHVGQRCRQHGRNTPRRDKKHAGRARDSRSWRRRCGHYVRGDVRKTSTCCSAINEQRARGLTLCCTMLYVFQHALHSQRPTITSH
jgi:hypothetical protein